MKIVRINHKYREFLKEKENHFQHEGIGVLTQISGDFYYLPITNKIQVSLPNYHEDNKFELIKDRKHKPIATIKIGDYFLIDKMLVITEIEMTELESQEAVYIRKNKKSILIKLSKTLNSSKRRQKRIIKHYNEFYKLNSELISQNRAFGKRYFSDAIKSMSIVEGVNITEEQIDKVIHYHDININIPDQLDTFAIKTIINMKYAWDEVMSKLDEVITLEYIININSLIARDEALEVNKIREMRISVSGTHEIPAPNPVKVRIELQKFMLFRDTHRIERDILDLYIYLIISQLFYDGNKRTAFLIANQLLVSLGFGILIIKDEHLETFNFLLSKIFDNNTLVERNEMIKFLQLNCIVRKKS